MRRERRERTARADREREGATSVRVSALTEGRRARARVSAVPGTRASVAVRVIAPRSDGKGLRQVGSDPHDSKTKREHALERR